ncbi:MAG: hypothetical protein LBR33_08445 [Propionibacteriaceae bacterium]|nr:hypothetical protein [Propionibacteriaceae bacterium]
MTDYPNALLVTKRQTLSPEERALPLARYFDLPLHRPGPLQQELLDRMPLDESAATPPEDWLDILQPVGYQAAEYGYCLRHDGTGYIASYTTYPGCTPAMLAWYFRWINIHSAHMPPGQGNLRYKIWNPADHWDHYFLNGHDKSGGIFTVESLDLGEGEEMLGSIRHALDPRDFGLTTARWEALQEAGCWVDCATESFHPRDDPSTDLPGTHLFLTLTRINPWGVLEKITREWIGWGVADGALAIDTSTPDWMLTEAYLKKVVTHGTVEAQQLGKFLPELYARYKDLPDDAD